MSWSEQGHVASSSGADHYHLETFKVMQHSGKRALTAGPRPVFVINSLSASILDRLVAFQKAENVWR